MALRRWTLSICGAAVIVAITAAAILLGAGLMVVVMVMPESLFKSEEDRLWVRVASCCRLLTVIQTSVGVAGYVIVSAGKARPLQLHICMFGVLTILLGQNLFILSLILQQTRKHVTLWLVRLLVFLHFGIRKAILYHVVKNKLAVLCSPRSSSRKAGRWVDATIASTTLNVLAGVGIWILAIWIRVSGRSLEAPATVAFEQITQLSVVEVTLMRLLYFAAILGILSSLVASVVVLALARHLTQTTVTRLAVRGVTAAMLSKVRSTLRLHLLGMVASIGTGWLVIVGFLINVSNALGNEAGGAAATSMLSAVDAGGDAVGFVLLSGVWHLLFWDDPDVGDFSRSTRSLLRSTVLTSRAERVFEGSVLETPSRMCVASFPGKFIEDWSELTWLCEQHELSSACVFLPTSDPKSRFGQHVECPEDPNKKCWCCSLYGEAKPWGCLWFDVWRGNIQKAVELGLELVVVFFPGQVGKGHVEWEFLPSTDLWDGVGLGGSQKGEVAFLRRSGIDFRELDLEEARKVFLDPSARGIELPRSHAGRGIIQQGLHSALLRRCAKLSLDAVRCLRGSI